MRLSKIELLVETIAKELEMDLSGPYRDSFDDLEFCVRVGMGFCIFRMYPDWIRAIEKDSTVLDVFLSKALDAQAEAARQNNYWKRRNLEHVR